MPVRPRCKARHHTWCLKACWPACCPVPHWRVVTMRVVGLGRLPPLQKLATAEAGGWVRPAHLLDSLGGNPQWQCKLASRQRPFLPGACRACDDHCGLPWRGPCCRLAGAAARRWRPRAGRKRLATRCRRQSPRHSHSHPWGVQPLVLSVCCCRAREKAGTCRCG